MYQLFAAITHLFNGPARYSEMVLSPVSALHRGYTVHPPCLHCETPMTRYGERIEIAGEQFCSPACAWDWRTRRP